MQYWSSFCSKGATFASPHLESDAFYCCLSKKRKNRMGSCFLLRRSSFSHQSLGNLGGMRRQNVLLGSPKLVFREPKMSPCRNISALSLALNQEPGGHESTEEGSKSNDLQNHIIGFSSPTSDANDQIAESKEEQVPKVEKIGGRNADELVGQERVDVRALALHLKDAKTADDVEELLKDISNLPLPVCSTMIRGFGVDKRLDSAFALVEWLKRKSMENNGSNGPNLFIYNSLLSAVKQTGQFDKVDKVMVDMRSQGIAPNIVTYNSLMSIYLEKGQSDDAISLLAEIENNGLSPSPATYSTVLSAYKKKEDAIGALEYFVKLREKYQKGEIQKHGDKVWEHEFVKLESFTIRVCYLVMRQWLVNKENAASDVLKLLIAMDEAQVRPSRVECERLVWACTRENHYIVAKELYQRIREMDNDISLSVCNHVIWLMGKTKKWWAALEIYEDLLDKGPEPNNLSYELIISHFNILLTAARRKGIWRWGVRLLNKMQDKGLRPGTREWNAVLVACSKASETSAAVQIFTRMVEQGEKPTVLSYGALLSALEKGKLYDEAIRVWEHMRKVGVTPNLYAFTILASVYIGKGNAEMVDSILHEMKSMGIEPTVVTFNAIITGCVKKSMGRAAFEWFNRMKVQNIKPNEITYDILIEALAKDGKPRLAYEMYSRARNEGLHLSWKTYDAVVESFQTSGTDMDLSALGPRPIEQKKRIRIRRDLSDFCNFADLPRRSRPFDEKEVYTSPMQER